MTGRLTHGELMKKDRRGKRKRAKDDRGKGDLSAFEESIFQGGKNGNDSEKNRFAANIRESQLEHCKRRLWVEETGKKQTRI